MSNEWPFSIPPNVVTLVSRYILEGEPITFAYRGWEDGTFQFLPDRITKSGDARLVALKEVFDVDSSIAELADLPPGWMAHRPGPTSAWEWRKDHPFPVFAERGFYLEDATEYERQCPDLYQVPSAAIRESLKVGDFVKLIFRFAEESSDREDNDSERMWVEVREVDEENGRYRGTLANDPRAHSQIAYGDELWFHPSHVFAVPDEEPSSDEG